jgi:structure-specific recognition protein 1
MHMQGAQYAYKVKYEDIKNLFLLPKADGGRMAFVISLEKPIRQGNQKYQNLVLETHKVEHTMRLNLTEDEIANTYDGQLATEMTLPMSSLIAKIFKVLTQKKVFVPAQFFSAREAHCVRCAVKASDGLLYPLAKSFIFINKPCIILRFEDVEYVEFKRYEPAANSATRNFDLAVVVKEAAVASQGEREYVFMSIDRSEYVPLSDYLKSKEIPIKNAPEAGAYGGKGRMDELLGNLEGEGDSGSEEGSEDDGDYHSGASSHSGDSDDSGVDESGSEGEGAGDAGSDAGAAKKVTTDYGCFFADSVLSGRNSCALCVIQRKKEKSSSGGAEKKRAKSSGSSKSKGKGGEEGKAAAKPKKAKKDKNAPKGEQQASSVQVF